MRETGKTPVTSPRETDERLEALMLAELRKAGEIASHADKMHRAAGDQQRAERAAGYGTRSRRVWGMTHIKVVAQLTAERAASPAAASLLDRFAALRSEMAAIKAEAAELDAVYQAAPWSRFFPCLASNGHIHSSLRGCHTIGWDTAMGWHPSLSGKSVEEAVQMPPKGLGPALCTHCFPGAPVKHTRMNLTQVERERTAGDRAAAKAVKAAANAVKNLTEAEQFRDAHRDRVRTVATARQVIRDEARFAHYSGIGKPHPNMYQDAKDAAATARRVLLARGVPAAELDEIAARADAKQRRDWAKVERERAGR